MRNIEKSSVKYSDNLEVTIKHRAPQRVFDVFFILFSSNKIQIRDLGKEEAMKYLCEAYDDCMIEYAVK